MKNMTKIYEENKGVRDFSLEVEKGEFISLLGPSGCGKTTTLNLIGGFIIPDRGHIFINEKEITLLPPEKRPVSTVFQNYALFPHLSVLENIAFGVRYFKKFQKRKALVHAKEFVDLVGLKGYEDVNIGNLSGGQQQRVALARSIATGAEVLLLDEPLSNLDASLRGSLRRELKELQRRTRVTMIFVTHDQGEALSLSDRIVVMDHGRIVQVGRPSEIYDFPKSSYVANFVGKTNKLTDKRGAAFFIRPEEIRLKKNEQSPYRIVEKMFLGHQTELILSEMSGEKDRVEVLLFGKEGRGYEVGDRVELLLNTDAKLKVGTE
ncbi:iron(III) transport system ATP-binding protein [Tindallia magadiensis]|uniref:ABC-type quaternary amine transporter n=1 Tax=Tindallia magadiensis TaxID=69895 RepID=A0A1I3FRQ5_9FIRM|nr:ABC transporter ATP-binding protein [Tindallia magadiensis]SFI13886.1 iron(III) transport system ATP-binding protein [Tindallia magadiensis]